MNEKQKQLNRLDDPRYDRRADLKIPVTSTDETLVYEGGVAQFTHQGRQVALSQGRYLAFLPEPQQSKRQGRQRFRK